MATDETRRYRIADTYKAIAEVEEKRSRFICHFFPVRTEEEAAIHIASIRKEFYDASHNCYAYVIGDEGAVCKKCSDDGEPRGTAGMPMLKALEAGGMYDTLAVVTRYFGGTLLGAGKLARTYAKTVTEGLGSAAKTYPVICSEVYIEADYGDFAGIENLLRGYCVGQPGIKFLEKVVINACLPSEKTPEAAAKISEATNGRVIVETLKEIRMDIAL